ncbi:MAG: FAD:protein FMN transferase [Verrucomicrobia bacterium]|nr:MAG: FAD:protein FMN transferase [Verrucomicrobiota bacterium]
MQTVTLARNAMATRFELVLHGENSLALQAAGEEALDEITRLENQLSLYRPGSEVAQLNARAAREAVRVTPEVFALLQHAQRLSAETGGAFDITIAPLVRVWGFMHNAGRVPTETELACALACVGMKNVLLDSANRTVRFAREGVMLDLGAIGKGYAIERAAEILREAGVTSALLHGGTSTVCAIGGPPDAAHWRVAIERPQSPEVAVPDLPDIPLADESLSVSAISGRHFESDGVSFGHVLDPRTGWPVKGALISAVVLPSATETDALSTALMVLGRPGQKTVGKSRPRSRSWLLTEEGLLSRASAEAASAIVQ